MIESNHSANTHHGISGADQQQAAESFRQGSDHTETIRAPGVPLSILVVEDDDLDFLLISRHLSQGKKRFELSHAISLGAALRELETRIFDVVLTDLNLPDSRGLDTVKALREHCGNAPMIVLTSVDDEAIEQAILAAGAQDFLIKGVSDSRWTRKAIEHAVQRQHFVNETKRVTHQLQESHRLLRQQAELREQDNRKLERLYQTAHEFLAKASHDIRNPLSVIREHVSIVRDGLAGRINTEQASMLEKAMLRTDDVNAKLQDLLDSSKLDSGLLDVCRRSCHINEIIEQVRTPLAQRAALNNVDLEILPTPDTPTAFCDEEKAIRVLTNLVVNAINACGEDGNVKVWVRHDPIHEEIRIGVTDNGVGIMPSQRDRMLNRFARVGLNTEPEDKLLGLGLSMATRFCRLNLGQLHVESEVGLGSVFWFSLPTTGGAEIFPRWLSLQNGSKRRIQLLSFQLGSPCSDFEIRDAGLLLGYLADNDELLLQSEPNHWWLASGTSCDDPRVRVEKATEALSRLVDVRAAKPDFEVKIESRAFLSLDLPAERILQEYNQVVQPLMVGGDGSLDLN